MESTTQMELLMIGELLRVEETAAKKAEWFSEMAQDPEIRKLLDSFADSHRQKIQGLVSKLEQYSGGGKGQYA